MMRRVMLIGGPLAGEEHIQSHNVPYFNAVCKPKLPLVYSTSTQAIQNIKIQTVSYDIKPINFEDNSQVWFGVMQPYNMRDGLYTIWQGYRANGIKLTKEEAILTKKAMEFYGNQIACGQSGGDEILCKLDEILEKLEGI